MKTKDYLQIFILSGIMLQLCGLSAYAEQRQSCSFTLAQLHYDGGGDWYANPSALPNLITAVKAVLHVPICDTVAQIRIDDDNLFLYPFLYMTGHGVVNFSLGQMVRLRRYLEAGGFLWADDNYGMDETFRQQMSKVFPENPLVELPNNHPIYKSKYLLPGLPKIHEHDLKPAQGLGIVFNGRLVVFYSYSSDIGDGMEDLDVHNDGPLLHELALKMGVNVIQWYFKQK